MDKIYPSKQVVFSPLTLAPEEETALKKALVLAIEKGIEHPQDRALYAVENAGLTVNRQAEIRTVLFTVLPLEEQVRREGMILAAEVEKAYEDGKIDEASLVPVISSTLVDPVIYAKRFLDVKENREMTPIFEVVEKPVEPIIEEEIKP